MKLKKVGNRKNTKGRNVYYQVIEFLNDDKKPVSRTIKHIQETAKKIQAASLMLKFHELRNETSTASERTLKRKRQRTFGHVVWNNGTYIKAIHGELSVK